MRAPLAAALLLALAAPAYADGYSGGGSGGAGAGVSSFSTACPASAGQPLSGAVTLTNGITTNARSGSPYVMVVATDATNDCANLTTISNGSAVSLATANYTAGNYFDIKNTGTVPVTLTPTAGTIDGATSVALQAGVSTRIVFDGTNYTTTLLPVRIRSALSVGHSIYYPLFDYGVYSAGGAPASQRLYCAPFVQDRPATITEVDIPISTTASGNVQMAFYASGIDATSNRLQPQGTPLANSASISTAASPAVWTGVALSLTRGVYFFCQMADNTTVRFGALSTTATPGANWLEGSITWNGATGATAAVGLSLAGVTYGVWPTGTGASFGENAAAEVANASVLFSSAP